MATTTYDPSRVNVIVAGATITGFTDQGNAIRLPKVEENYSAQEGLTGDVTFSKNKSSRRILEIDLMQNSPSNDVLSGFAVADRKAAGGVLYPFSVVDKNGASIYIAGSAVIVSVPNPEFGQEAGIRTWRFDGVIDEEFTGGAGEGGIAGLLGSLF